MEDMLYEVESVRRFAGLKLTALPDETTILNFRHLLERHGTGVNRLMPTNRPQQTVRQHDPADPSAPHACGTNHRRSYPFDHSLPVGNGDSPSSFRNALCFAVDS